MPYTVWSNDRLVGETDLDYITNTSESKFGDFDATEYGEQIISDRMAPRKAVCARASLDEVEQANRQRESIPLELRAPDGRVVATDDIEITDLEWLLSLAPLHPIADDWRADLDQPTEFDEFDVPEMELADGDEPPPDFPRYQIQVRIKNGG